jgi:hypothetical protein
MTAMNLMRAAALGAAAMYLFDPDRGRRRRAIARDKARSGVHQGTQFLSAARSDAAARMQGLRAVARRFRRRSSAPADDRVLEARVRARLGRVVAHPHAVHVAADDGDVRLSGPILKSEHTPLVVATRLVRGVRSVDDRDLVLHETPDGVPALQGQGRYAAGDNPGQVEWSPAVRLSAIAGGGALALYGLTCSGLSRLALSGAGLALVARGSVNVPVTWMLSGAGEAASRMGRRTGQAVEEVDTSDDWSRGAIGGTRGDGSSRSRQYLQQGGTRQPAGTPRPGMQHGARQAGGMQGSTQAGSQRDSGMQQGAGARARNAQLGAGTGMGGSAQAAQRSAASGGARTIPIQEGDLGVGAGAGAQYAYPSTARELSQQETTATPGRMQGT